MRDLKSDFQILDFAAPKRTPGPEKPIAEAEVIKIHARRSNDLLLDYEPWNGWRLVAGWTIGYLIGWAILFAAAYGLFALASWARGFW